MYKETVPFVNGWWYFHFTKERFLFVVQNEKRVSLCHFHDFWDTLFSGFKKKLHSCMKLESLNHNIKNVSKGARYVFKHS